MALSPCETCPHRIPMDRETWDKVKKAQQEATPELSKGQCARLTKIERKSFEGLEANISDCHGYSKWQGIGNYLLRKVSLAHKLKKTEAGGTRFVGWSERTCNNPWLENPEYFELKEEFNAVGTEGQEKRPSIFKTDEQREAYLEGEVGKLRMVSGMAVMALGAAGVEAAPEPLSTGAVGIAGYGLYRAITGGYDMARATWREHQAFRNSD